MLGDISPGQTDVVLKRKSVSLFWGIAVPPHISDHGGNMIKSMG